jgi:hypothetical protein
MLIAIVGWSGVTFFVDASTVAGAYEERRREEEQALQRLLKEKSRMWGYYMYPGLWECQMLGDEDSTRPVREVYRPSTPRKLGCAGMSWVPEIFARPRRETIRTASRVHAGRAR